MTHDDMAQLAIDSNNFEQAITEWNLLISDNKTKGIETEGETYAKLGKAYTALEQYEKAEAAFDIARNKNYGDDEMYVLMSKRYRNIDNLSKEIKTLKYYNDHYSQYADSSLMRNRLFVTYIESENWPLAEEIWQQMDEPSKAKEEYLEKYLFLNKKTDQKKKCDKIALQLLQVNSNNIAALEWLAKKYYNRAEDRYQKAMAAYNKNKTNKQYQILLKELNRVTTDFKLSLNYFNPLWEMDKKYAPYMANIYARFDDKKKSQYYKSFIKK